MPDAQDIQRTEANYVPLSPASFLRRAALLYPNKDAVIYGARRHTYRSFLERSEALARALVRAGVTNGERVGVLAFNTPEMLEAHFAGPMADAVLVPINIRLDAEGVGFIIRHSKLKALIFDREFSPLLAEALAQASATPLLIQIDDPNAAAASELDALEYEAFIASTDRKTALPRIVDEWRSISLNYTSGTTGDPKGVLLHHRGAYLNACSIALGLGLNADSRYLWTLPMFHCNGWSFTWAVALVGATHVCLRKFEPAATYAAIKAHRATHLCGAPIVLQMLADAPEAQRRRFEHDVQIATGGAAPTSTIIARMESMGFVVTHLYGMTESYGPSLMCVRQDEVERAPIEERAAFYARQGVLLPMVEAVAVLDANGVPLPADGLSIGELAIRSNTVMKGYYANLKATASALKGGWLHTGDLAVQHADGYIEIKDRLKDIIISGGENISSLEVEDVIAKHPAVAAAAVVAHPDPKWGETPHAFIELRPGIGAPQETEFMDWLKERMPGFKRPRHITFGTLPKTATGKIQKHLLRARVRESGDGR